MTIIGAVGEVHTALLQTSGALSNDVAGELLSLRPGQPVRQRSRPVRTVWSPEEFTGVDCAALPHGSRGHLVGTLRSQACLTEGHLLQTLTSTVLHRADQERRRSWSHYLSRPGTVELFGTGKREDVIAGFLAEPRGTGELDVGAVSSRLLAQVQSSAWLDRRPPVTGVRRTRMRWVVRASANGQQSAAFTLDSSGVSVLDIRTPEPGDPAIAEFSADLALHDWLLLTLRSILDRVLAGPASPRRGLPGLRPAIIHLVHTWMPGTRVEDGLATLWQDLERRACLSTQWNTTVARARDYVSISLAEGLFTDAGASARAGAASPVTPPVQERS